MAFKRSDKSAKESQQAAADNAVVREKIYTLSSTRNWYIDRHQRLILQRNFLLIITLVCLVFLGLSVLSVSELNKRKVFEPFVIEVEDKSGIVTQVSHKDIENYSSEESVVKYFLNKYIQARETYHPVNYQYNYYTVVRLLSADKVFGEFSAGLANKEAVDNPFKIGRNVIRKANITSITFLDNGNPQDTAKTVQIRISTEDVPIDNPTASYSKSSWLVTLRFNFVILNLGQSDRYVNPLGFQVTSYQKVPDTSGK